MFAQVAKILWDVVSRSANLPAAFSRFIRSPVRLSRAKLPLSRTSHLQHPAPPFRPIAFARHAALIDGPRRVSRKESSEVVRKFLAIGARAGRLREQGLRCCRPQQPAGMTCRSCELVLSRRCGRIA